MFLRVRDLAWATDGPRMGAGGRRVLGGLGLSALAVCAGLAATSHRLGAALIGLLLLFLYVGYAAGHPRGAVIIMLASLALVPVYAVPTFRSFVPEPAAVAAVVVAVLFIRIGAPIKLTMVDLAFTATCVAMMLAVLLGPRSLLATLSELFLWVPPFIAGRAICKRRNGAEVFALAVAIAGLISLPFIAYETITRDNIFFKFAKANTELTTLWAHPAFRPGGLLRSEGPFGHPLSMSLIVGSCSIFALALALRANSRRRQVGWSLATVGLVIGQYTSHERSGWFVVVGGLLLFAGLAASNRWRMRHVVAVIAVMVPLAFIAVSATHTSTGEQGVQREESNADRIHLWQHAFEPGALALVGLRETGSFNHFANGVRPGQTAIDSGYLQIGDIYGVIAMVALFIVVIAVICVAFRMRGTWAAVIPAVALVDLIALAVIGFQTQVPIFVWLLVGAVSGVELRRRSSMDQTYPAFIALL
jgi:hypothetical protein